MTDPGQSYRLGYAESRDRSRRTRLDQLAGLERSLAGVQGITV